MDLTRQFMSTAEKKILFKAIENNSYYGHPENIVFSMLKDDSEAVQHKAISVIEGLRSETNTKRRIFRKPKLNLGARAYYELSDIRSIQCEPPATVGHPVREAIPESVFSGKCHTQFVEQTVKLVSEASRKVVGQTRRNGFIRTVLKSRKNIPFFGSKKHWK
jgi:hypothetical protein